MRRKLTFFQGPYPIPDQSAQTIPYFRPKWLKNRTLWCRTYLYSLYKGVPLPGLRLTFLWYFSLCLLISTIISAAFPTIVAKMRTPQRYVKIQNSRLMMVCGVTFFPVPTVVMETRERNRLYRYCGPT